MNNINLLLCKMFINGTLMLMTSSIYHDYTEQEQLVTYLRETRADPNRIEDGVGEYSLEDIALTMNFPSIEFVEESHHDERVEDDGEVLRGSAACCCHSAARIDVEHQVTCGSRS